MAAKNWWDTAAPTMEMGGLLGMPSMTPTEEDKRQALKQMLMQMGMGMVANSHKGNQAALGAGLLGGVQGYQQGMQGPMNRFEMAKQQLDFQGKQLGNAKTIEELGKLKRDATDYSKQNDFLSMLTNPAALSMMGGGGPTNAALDRASQFASNPAAALSDPNVNLRALAARVDPKQLGAALENTRPFAMDAGKTYQYADGRERYIPKIADNTTRNPDGSMSVIPGATNALAQLAAAPEWGKLNPQKAFEAFKMNNALQTDPTTGIPFRVGESAPVIGNPEQQGMGGAPRGQPRQAALTPAQQASQANLTKGNDVWREQTLIPILKAEGAARESNNQIKALNSISLTTGFGTEGLAALSSPFAALGYKPAKEYTASVESFRSIVNDQQLVKQMQQAGVQTEGDAKRSQATLASLGNTPQANEFIKDFAQATNNAVLAKAQFYNSAHNHALERGESNLSKLDMTWRKAGYSIWDDPIMARWKKK